LIKAIHSGMLITVSPKHWIFQTCGSTATDVLMLLYTQYKTIRSLSLSAVSLSRCITIIWVCLFEFKRWSI